MCVYSDKSNVNMGDGMALILNIPFCKYGSFQHELHMSEASTHMMLTKLSVGGLRLKVQYF